MVLVNGRRGKFIRLVIKEQLRDKLYLTAHLGRRRIENYDVFSISILATLYHCSMVKEHTHGVLMVYKIGYPPQVRYGSQWREFEKYAQWF